MEPSFAPFHGEIESVVQQRVNTDEVFGEIVIWIDESFNLSNVGGLIGIGGLTVGEDNSRGVAC